MKPRLSMKLLWKYWGAFKDKKVLDNSLNFLTFVESEMKSPKK